MASRLSGVCVVIPTYNEAENLGRLVEDLRGLSPELGIIVVDDGSPDGTGALAEGLAERFPPMRVIHRRGKGGRGSACLEGFSLALQDRAARCVVEMDADLSHDPAELPEMVDRLSDCDVVVRSRYRPGSRVVGWSRARRVFSRCANLFARAALDVRLSDYTNGYRAYSRRALEAVKDEKFESSGYIVLSEIAVRLHAKGFRFQELPSVFIDRRRGESNLTREEILGAALGLLRLAWRGGR